MKQIKNLFILALIGVFSFTSCDTEETIPGHDITTGPAIVGWGDKAATLSYFSDIGILNNMYPVDLLGSGDGAPTTSDINISISVDPSSTAVSGNEYTLPASVVTIPAGGTFAGVPVNINTGGFNPAMPTFLLLNIETTTNGAVVSTLASQFQINFVGCKSTLADYNYSVTITRENTGQSYSAGSESISLLDVNYFQTETVMYFPVVPGVIFTDICGALTAVQQDLGPYSNQVTGSYGAGTDSVGSVDPVTGDFELRYYVSPSGTTEWGHHTAVYTKN